MCGRFSHYKQDRTENSRLKMTANSSRALRRATQLDFGTDLTTEEKLIEISTAVQISTEDIKQTKKFRWF